MHAEDVYPVQAVRTAYGARARRDLAVAIAPITVMVGSSQPALHAAMHAALAGAPGIRLLPGSRSDDACLDACASPLAPQVLLLDKAWLDAGDAHFLDRIRESCPWLRILLVPDRVTPTVVSDVVRHRLDGFLPADSAPETCRKAIQKVGQGELWLSRGLMAQAIAALHALSPSGAQRVPGAPHPDGAETLTPRETEVVSHLRRGYTNKEIARALGIKEDTVKKHLQSVFAKLGVHRRTLVLLAG